MKKSFFYYMIVNIIVLILFASCSKSWLNEKSDKSLAVPATTAELQAILDNFTKMNMSTVILSEIASDGHYYTDNDFNPYLGKIYQNAYTWSNKVSYEMVGDWNTPYSAILMLNVVLDGADKLEQTTENQNLIGQALFQRSRLFYDLAQTFAVPYSENIASSPLGIPLRLSTEITQPSRRTTIKETYDRIINDLKSSIDLLPVTPVFLTRGSKPAALALIARVYLSMQKYDSALVYANRCLALKNDLLDYNTLPIDKPFIGINSEVLFASFHISLNLMTSNYLIDPNLYNLYSSNDLRKSIFFLNNNGRIQFKGTYGNSATDIFTGISLDEVYLIKSECLARTKQIAQSMEILDDLLRTRWKTNNGISSYVNQNADTESEALTIILEERKKQLIQRNLRWSDLRRLNLDARFAIVLTRELKGETYILEPDSYQYTFPIPNDIIQKTQLQQNPDWPK